MLRLCERLQLGLESELLEDRFGSTAVKDQLVPSAVDEN